MILSVSAASTAPPASSSDTSTFDQILQPVWKLYKFLKYIATAVATLVLVYAGITYAISGSDVTKRESAKHMIGYVVLGMIVIWAAPFIVQLLAT